MDRGPMAPEPAPCVMPMRGGSTSRSGRWWRPFYGTWRSWSPNWRGGRPRRERVVALVQKLDAERAQAEQDRTRPADVVPFAEEIGGRIEALTDRERTTIVQLLAGRGGHAGAGLGERAVSGPPPRGDARSFACT